MHTQQHAASSSPWIIFLLFLQLGLTSFGGPIAHIGYFRDAFVIRRQWLTEQCYADLVALCQFLPGPASSQVGMAIGLSRGGYAGALAAWMGFTLPSAMVLIICALGMTVWHQTIPAGLVQGLKIVAVAVVAQAIWGMARHFCTNALRVTLAIATAGAALLWTSMWIQCLLMLIAGGIGMMCLRPTQKPSTSLLFVPGSRMAGASFLCLFGVLLIGLPLVIAAYPNAALALFDVFYRAGALVFGGGHVVLPLLESQVVQTSWVSSTTFLAGYGLAQAVPGPLFTFAAFLGASMTQGPQGVAGGLIALLAIFLPSFLLIAGALPFWAQLRQTLSAQAAMAGVNAAVVGLLIAAFYQPVLTSAIQHPADIIWALLALCALLFWKVPPWLVVVLCGTLGWVLDFVG